MKYQIKVGLKAIISFILISTIASAVFAATQAFTSSPNVAIPDATGGSSLCAANNVGGSVSDDIDVTLGGIVTNVTVNLNITHTFIGDLIVTLTSPSGTTVRIIDKIGVAGNSNCGCSSDDIVATLSDAGGTPIEGSCGSQGGGGTFSPANALSAFNGESASGIWTLTVIDDDVVSTGTLDSWSITISVASVSQIADDDIDGIPLPAFYDGRINDYDTAAPVAVYPHEVDGEIGLIIYNPDGVQLLVVSPEQIADVSDNPSDNVLVASANGVSLYRIPGGYWQINAPQYNGKTYVMIFSELFHSGGYESFEFDA